MRHGWSHGRGVLARIQRTPTAVIASGAVVVWVISGLYMVHFGAGWHLDLRVYRCCREFALPWRIAVHRRLHRQPLALHLHPVRPHGLEPALLRLARAGRDTLVVDQRRVSGRRLRPHGHHRLRHPTRSGVGAGRAGVRGGHHDPRAGAQQFQLRPDQRGPVADGGRRPHPGTAAMAGRAGRPGRSDQAHPVGVSGLLRRGQRVALAAPRRRRVRRGHRGQLGGPPRGLRPLLVPRGHRRRTDRQRWATSATSRGTGWSTEHPSTGATSAPPCGWCCRWPPWWPASTLTRWLVAGDRTAEAVIALALTEVLVSPVSWSHHWSWLALAPVAVVSVWRVHRAVAWALVVLVGVGVANPYLWVRRVPISYRGGELAAPRRGWRCWPSGWCPRPATGRSGRPETAAEASLVPSPGLPG